MRRSWKLELIAAAVLGLVVLLTLPGRGDKASATALLDADSSSYRVASFTVW